MNKKIIALARSKSAIDAINQDLIRCGFEFEFRSLNGVKSMEADHERMWQVARDNLTDEDIKKSLDEEEIKLFDKVCETVGATYGQIADPNHPLDIPEHVRTFLRSIWKNASDDAVSSIVDNMNTDEYRVDCYDTWKNIGDFEKYIDKGEDSSCPTGGEIRTVGAMKPGRAIRTFKELLKHNAFTVDEGTSFHIHISVPGVRHSYSKSIKAEMMNYLADNLYRFPDCVVQRCRTDNIRFFQCSVDHDKMTMVNFHERNNTWEFRLFGNISTVKDATRCLLLAVEAVRHAYRVKLNIEKSNVISYVNKESITLKAFVDNIYAIIFDKGLPITKKNFPSVHFYIRKALTKATIEGRTIGAA